MHCIKIGVSRSDNTSNTTTTTTTTTTTSTAATATTSPTTTELPATTTTISNYDLDINGTSSALSDAVTTPSQTFPPRRKTSKPRPTTAPTKRSSTPATTAENAPNLNATTAPATALHRKDSRFYYCSCDVQQDLCEVNCCCDRDCSQDSLQVFSCLPEQHTRLEDFQYSHGLPTCQINDGWLCVFRSHTKPAKKQSPSQIFDSKDYNRWPEQLDAFETPLPATPTTSHYKFGQALQLWQPESKSLTSWELPLAYESASCQLKQTLLYLQSMQSSCLLSDVSQLQMSLWNLLNLTSSHQLLSKPIELEEQQVHGLSIKICQQLLLQPQIQCFEGNDTQVDIIVDRIELQVLHNYTNILKAKLLLREVNVEDDNQVLWLTYAVVYESSEAAKTKPSSGSLGYEVGAPLLLAMLPKENSSKTEQLQQEQEQQQQQHQQKQQFHLLNYYQSQNSSQVNQHWLMPCSQSLEQRHAVSFGIDLAKQCQLRQLSPVPEHENHTDYCQQLQLAIWRQLLPHNCTQLEQVTQQVFVSQLGRPQLDKWLPLQLSHADGPPIQATYDAKEQSLSCRNIWLSVSYEFYVSELTLLEGQIPHQNVLQHARLVLGQRHDLEFDAAEEHIQLPLAVSVMFFKAQNRLRNNSNNLIVLDYRLIFISIVILMIAAQRYQLS